MCKSHNLDFTENGRIWRIWTWRKYKKIERKRDMNGTERHMNGNEKKCKRNMKGNNFSELDLSTFQINSIMKPTSHGLF